MRRPAPAGTLAAIDNTPRTEQPDMTAPRIDLYGPIHKAIRRFMNDTLHRVGAADIADDAALNAVLDQVDMLVAGLRSHVKHENDFVHAAIEARQPGGARGTAEEHVEHLDSLASLESEVVALRAAPQDQRDTRVARLYRNLALLVAENLQHMHIEETANNALLWSLYSDAELMDIHDRLVASIAPAEMMNWLRWMAPSLAPAELAGMLGDMREKAPAEAFGGVLQVVRSAVDTQRWTVLERSLGLARAA
jgi:hypothetical protein